MDLILGGVFTFLLILMFMEQIKNIRYKTVLESERDSFRTQSNWEKKLSGAYLEKLNHLKSLNKEICHKLNIPVPEIYWTRTNRSNAYAVNSFGVRRVVFGTNLLKDLDKDALGAILAHEIHHIYQAHGRKGLVWRFCLDVITPLILFLGIVNLINIISPNLNFWFELIFYTPLVIACQIWSGLLGDVILKAISRRQELNCDLFSAKMVGINSYEAEAFYFRREELVKRSLIYKIINYTHPTWDERITFVQNNLK